MIQSNAVPNNKNKSVMKDSIVQKWEEKVNFLWPWKNGVIEELKQKVGFSSFYPISGEGSSPYGSANASKLVLQMHSVFQRITETAQGDQIPIEEGMLFAESYRKIIHQSCEAVCQEVKSSEETSYADALMVADTLWGLVEHMFIRPLNRSVVADLLEWANETFGHARELLSEVQQFSDRGDIEDAPFFWSAIISLILIGQFNLASDVLKLASDYRKNFKFQRMSGLLAFFNYKDLHFETSAVKFKNAQKEVRKHMASFVNDEPLYFICKILTGDIDAFTQAAQSLSRQWYEMLPAFVTFKQPTADYEDLGQLSLELYNAIETTNPVGNQLMNTIILSLMKLNWIEAFSELASVSSLSWLSVHLFDLILRVEDTKLRDNMESMRDDVVVAYAKELFRTPNNAKLIPCATSYAFATKTFKHDFVESFLIIIAENDGPSNMELINTLLGLCREYGLYEAYHQITLALACIALRARDWSLAIHYALKNETIQKMDTIAYMILVNASPAEIKKLNVFDEENEKINESNAMTFLLRFHQFNISLEAHDIPKCTSLLHDLITSNLAPPEFIHVLFDNVADVIDATNKCCDKEPLLNFEAITSLQRAVVLYQKQEAIRIQGSRMVFDYRDRVERKSTFLHSVLNNALALIALRK